MTGMSDWFLDAPPQPEYAPVPDIQVVEYLGRYERVDASCGINRLVSLSAILQTDSGARVAVRTVEHIREDNRHPVIVGACHSYDVDAFIRGMHASSYVIVVVRP